jgi:uncharacterized protein YbbK (DUF523 family)
MHAARLSALRTGRLYHPKISLALIFFQRMSPSQGHSAIRRSKSVRNPNDTMGNRTRDLQTCNAVSKPTAPPRTPIKLMGGQKFRSRSMKLQTGHIKVTEWTRKLRNGHKISGWTGSFAFHTLFREDTYSFGQNKKFRGEHKVSRWIQSSGVDTKLRQQSILRKGIC